MDGKVGGGKVAVVDSGEDALINFEIITEKIIQGTGG